MRDRRLLQLILLFAALVACVAIVSAIAHASTNGTSAKAAIGQTEPPAGGEPAGPDSAFSGELYPNPKDDFPSARPDSSVARPDSASAARADSVSAVPPDSTSGARPDSVGVGGKPKQTALPDTLQFLPPPGSRTGVGPKPGEGTTAPKERTGIWGITPIAILLGIAVLHYFIIKAASN